MVHDGPEPLAADCATADVFVAIAVLTQAEFRIVAVDELQPLQAEDAVKSFERIRDCRWCPQVVTGGERVAGIKADVEPVFQARLGFSRPDQPGEVVETAADRIACAGGQLQQQPGRAAVAGENLLERAPGFVEPAFRSGSLRSAEVGDDVVRPEQGSALQFLANDRHRPETDARRR